MSYNDKKLTRWVWSWNRSAHHVYGENWLLREYIVYFNYKWDWYKDVLLISNKSQLRFHVKETHEQLLSLVHVHNTGDSCTI